MKRKAVAMLLCAAMVIGTLAACGGTGSEPSGATGTEAESEAVSEAASSEAAAASGETGEASSEAGEATEAAGGGISGDSRHRLGV